MLAIAASASRSSRARRYTAVSPKTWVFNNGHYYPCSDPIIGAEGTDGSVWSRFADAAIGKTYNGSPITRVVIGNCAAGSTSINDWAPSGVLNSYLQSRLTDYVNHVGMPTHLCYSPGEEDSGLKGMATQQWINQWPAMLTTIRNIGCNTQILTSVETANASASRFKNPPDPPFRTSIPRPARIST
jgi:hypothetical protein